MFYFLQKLPVTPLKNYPDFPSLKSKFSDRPQQVFYKSFSPRFWKMGCKCHDIAKSAGSQANNKSPKHDSMTTEFCKNFYQKTNLKDFRLGIKKVLEKSQIRWRHMLVPQPPFWKLIFGNSSQKLHIVDAGL